MRAFLVIWITLGLGSYNIIGSDELEEKDAVIVCYYDAMSFWREDIGKFQAEDIDGSLCTHLIYSHMGLSERTYKVYSREAYLDLGEGEVEPDPDPQNPENTRGGLDMIRRTVQLRAQNPNLKVLISVGGEVQNSMAYSNMIGNDGNRGVFINSVLDYIGRYDLDGIDIDWRFPGNTPNDKHNFVTFFKEMREALDEVGETKERRYLLTGAFGCYKDVIDKAYDLPQLSLYLDLFHLMCFDFKVATAEGEESKIIGHHSPLHPKDTDSPMDQQLTAEMGVNYFLESGAPPQKVLLGVSSYGRTYELLTPDEHEFGQVAKGPGSPGPFLLQQGLLSYYEICYLMKENGEAWNRLIDYSYGIPWAFTDNSNGNQLLQWVGYDDEVSAQEKVDFAVSKGLGGIMLQYIDMDDCKNVCGGWFKCPILSSIKDRLLHSNANTSLNN